MGVSCSCPLAAATLHWRGRTTCRGNRAVLGRLLEISWPLLNAGFAFSVAKSWLSMCCVVEALVQSGALASEVHVAGQPRPLGSSYGPLGRLCFLNFGAGFRILVMFAMHSALAVVAV